MKRIIITLGLSLLCASAFAQGLSPNGGSGGGTTGPGIITACSASNNQLLYDNAGSCAGLATANNGVLVTNGSGVPSISTTLPAGLTITGYLPLSAGSGNALTGNIYLPGINGINASGSNATATGITVTNSLSTGTATNPDLIFQTGVKTTTGSAQATATTALTIKGETGQLLALNGSASAPTYAFANHPGTGFFDGGGTVNIAVGTTQVAMFNSGGMVLPSAFTLGWSDVFLSRDAAGILAQVNGANAQSFRPYNNSSSANANYERGVFGWTDTSNVLTIGTQNAGTGVARNMQFVIGGANKLDYGVTIGSTWSVLANLAVGANSNISVSNGQFIINGTIALYSPSNGIFQIRGAGAVNPTALVFGSGTSSGAAIYTNGGTTSAFRLGDNSAYAPVEAGTVRTATAYTVSTLPTGAAGMRAYVTDQLTACPALGVALTGGGAVVCPAFYNGSAWVGG